MAQVQSPSPQDARRGKLRELSRSKDRIERLLDLQMQYDLGLVRDLDESVIDTGSGATSANLSRLQSEFEHEHARSESLTRRLERLRNEYERLQQEVAALDAPEEPGTTVISVPTAGHAIGEEPRVASPLPAQPTSPLPAAPGVETVAVTETPEGVPPGLILDPLRATIQGSKDHQRVAAALFKAGQKHMDDAARMRAAGKLEYAKVFDEHGRQKLLRAIDELKPLLDGEDPPYVSLFYLGRCRELLFRYSERYEGLSLENSTAEYQRREQEVREPFLQISARDVVKVGTAGKMEVLGPWGQAAKTAMENFRWMNVNGRYDATARIEALTWPGQGKR